MDRKTYTICGIIIVMCLGAVIGWSVEVGNPILLIPAFIMSISLLYLCKGRVKEVIEDERTYKISERASKKTLEIFMTVTAITSGILIASRDRYDSFQRQIPGTQKSWVYIGILNLWSSYNVSSLLRILCKKIRGLNEE